MRSACFCWASSRLFRLELSALCVLRSHHESGEGAGPSNRGAEAGGGGDISSETDRNDALQDPQQNHSSGSRPAHGISVSERVHSCPVGKTCLEVFTLPHNFLEVLPSPDLFTSWFNFPVRVSFCWLCFLPFSIDFRCSSSAFSQLRQSLYVESNVTKSE